MPSGRSFLSKSRGRSKKRKQSRSKLLALLGFGLAVVLAVGTVVTLAGVSAARDAAAQESSDSYVPAAIPTDEPRKVAPTVLFIGDSYTAGNGASAPELRWSSVVSEQLGWVETNKAYGGTGYVTSSDINGCGMEFCPNYGGTIAEVTGITPSIVVLAGGRNDGANPPGYTATVQVTIDAAKARWPKASIVIASPIWDDDPAPAHASAHIESVREAAAASGATFLDLGAPMEGHPDFVDKDGVHPNDAGHKAIADSFVAAWVTSDLAGE